jgi:hypothetical protein
MIPARATRKASGLNKLEQEYYNHLLALKANGEIAGCMPQPLKLNLAPGLACTYTPDFMVIRNDGILEFHETKGFWHDDARVKIKVAASKFPFVFVAVTKPRKSSPWQYEHFTNEALSAFYSLEITPCEAFVLKNTILKCASDFRGEFTLRQSDDDISVLSCIYDRIPDVQPGQQHFTNKQ